MTTKQRNGKAKEKVDATLVEITERVIEQMESDPGDWTKPWRDSMVAGGLPVNALTKRRYSGGNLFWLSVISHAAGWRNVWGTYKQWQQLDCQVRGGEKGTLALFYKRLTITEQDDDGEDRKKIIPLLRSFVLFNAEQVDGANEVIEARFGSNAFEHLDPIAHAEEFFAEVGADLRHGGDHAFYSPSEDYIRVPDLEQFESAEHYYATLSHEHIHWTSHESRLDRTTGKHFGEEVYAREELVADLGAAFVMGYLGIETESRSCDTVAYLHHWIGKLREEPRALWSALGDAARALDFMVHEAGENGETLETSHEEAA